MQLDAVEACLDCPACGLAESSHDSQDFIVS